MSTPSRRPWFQFGLVRLFTCPVLVCIAIAAARVPIAVATSGGRAVVSARLEHSAPILAMVSGACAFASIGILFNRGGEATILGMLVGVALGVVFC